MAKVTISEIKDCYIKLKSYVYYENFAIGLKAKLAQFEARHLERKLAKLVNDLNQHRATGVSNIDAEISAANYFLTPKKFREEELDQTSGFYFSNENKQKKYEIDNGRNINAFIDCSIELHLVTILWILRIGIQLDRKIGAECFSNRISRIQRDSTIINNRIKLFDRYYINYNRWRDSAIWAAKKEHGKGNNVAILNLDVQSYFNSVDFDLTRLKVKAADRWLNRLLSKLHIHYANLLFEKGVIKVNKRILPIGLISSTILSNYYLASFDGLIRKKVSPLSYGRYVDDILIVFSNPKLSHNSPTFLADFIEENICFSHKMQIGGVKYDCNVVRMGDDKFSISIDGNELMFQLAKVKLYHFHKEDSLSVLDGFEREIRRNSSEFRFQLETNDLFDSFEDASYEITYGDTVNKLRSIEKFNANKFGASKHLTKLINGTKQTHKLEKRKLAKVSSKILQFFSGRRALQLVGLWDKVFTFFLINRQENGLVTFSKHLLQEILKIEFRDPDLSDSQNEDIDQALFEGLLDQLILAYAMAASLDISFLSAKVLSRVRTNVSDEFDSFLSDLTEGNIKRLAQLLIKSNLFRQTYLPYPLINYCRQSTNYSFNTQMLSLSTSFKIDKTKIEYSPRFISYHEVEMFYYIQSTFLGKPVAGGYVNNRLDFVFNKYLEFNNSKGWKKGNLQRPFFPKKIGRKSDPMSYLVSQDDAIDKLRIGLVNIRVFENYTLSALKRRPVLSFERLDAIHKVLNEAVKSKCELIIFPEISVPFQWLSRLTEFSNRNQIAIICGIEHFVNSKGEAFNYVATILPFKVRTHKNAFLDLRLKIDYAPGEVTELKKLGYKIPKAASREALRIFSWRNTCFSVLNCFELTDINKRIKFKGKIDFITAVEFNRDVTYFSSINESLARDLHCYVIQVNTSHYGDSRITLPSDSFNRDYVKLKGGENISLVTGYLSIKNLRAFQSIASNGRKMPKKLAGQFKPLPPNYELSKDRAPVGSK